MGFGVLKVGEEHRRGRGFCGILGFESGRRAPQRARVLWDFGF